MDPSTEQKTLGVMPGGRFVTTYSRDYKPFSERQPQVNQTKPKIEAAPINLPETYGETWPGFHQYIYKTPNSVYGSSGCSQPPSCSLLPASLPPLGTLAPPAPTVSRVVGSTLTEAEAPEVGAARDAGPLVGEEEKGPKANVLEQQEAKDEPQQKIDVHYEEGVIVLPSHIDWACCEDFLRSVCREAGLQHLLHLPVNSSPVIAVEDAESWGNSACLRPAPGLKNNTFLQPIPRQCTCCAAVCPHSCCFKMQGPARGQPTVHHTEPSSRPWLTEYRANYTAARAQPKIQQ